MAIKVITPNSLDYFKELQDQYNALAYSLKEHTHSPQSLGAAQLLHEHEMADVNGLYNALNNKSSVGHKHTVSDIEGWQVEDGTTDEMSDDEIIAIWNGATGDIAEGSKAN